MLDIIIPTYNDTKGLRCTLNSIDLTNPEIRVIAINDCSEEDYSEFSPYIFYLFKNVGPGNARQIGFYLTSNPYVMFIDSGDYLLDKDVINEVITTLKTRPDIDIFSWQYIAEKTNKPSTEDHNRLHGRVYRRDFLIRYGIEFCSEGSYANEDIGFNRLCRMMAQDGKAHILCIEKPIIMWTYADDSLTNSNDGAYTYEKQNMGLALNMRHAVTIAEKNKVSPQVIKNEVNSLIAWEYYYFLNTVQRRSEFALQAWNGAKYFYDNLYQYYADENTPTFQPSVSRALLKSRRNRAQQKWKFDIPFNIKLFIKDLKENDSIPEKYLTYIKNQV